MIKTHQENVTKEETEIDDIICNCCGKPFNKTVYENVEDCLGNISDMTVINEGLSINQQWGYHSNYDTEVHKFDICQDCYDKWIKTFKIPIEIKDYM